MTFVYVWPVISRAMFNPAGLSDSIINKSSTVNPVSFQIQSTVRSYCKSSAITGNKGLAFQHLDQGLQIYYLTINMCQIIFGYIIIYFLSYKCFRDEPVRQLPYYNNARLFLFQTAEQDVFWLLETKMPFLTVLGAKFKITIINL